MKQLSFDSPGKPNAVRILIVMLLLIGYSTDGSLASPDPKRGMISEPGISAGAPPESSIGIECNLHGTLSEVSLNCARKHDPTRLAQQLLSNQEDRQNIARQFIFEHQYNSQHRACFLSMVSEVNRLSQEQDDGLKDTLKILEFMEQGKEIMGVQHLILQLRMIHGGLLIAADEKVEEGMNALKNKFSVLVNLQW